jgi:two-component system cell cycle sensor histidine kinase/response regulator CckA
MIAFNEEKYLSAEQVWQLYTQAPLAVVATLVNSLVLTLVLWRVIPHSTLIIWLSATVATTLLRYSLLYKYYHASATPGEAGRWSGWFIINITISGLLWGSAGIFLFPAGSMEYQVFVAFVLGGMVAGAAGTISVIMTAFLAYSLPALLPIIIRFFLIGTEIHLAMGGMAVLFWLLMFFTARQVNNTIKLSLKLKVENSDLVTYLEEAKEGVEKANEELKAEIIERKKAEEELQKHQEHLEVIVKERTAELRASNQELQVEIAERKRTEEALKESEEKYRLLVENANDAILIVQDGFVRFCNQRTEQLIGYSAAEMATTPFTDYVHPEDRDELLERYMRRLNGEGASTHHSFKVINKSGAELWGQVNSVSITWEGKPAVLSFVRDVTIQKKLETRLQQAQKMEAIGTLAGGIAHDFNNLLMAIQGNASLMLTNIDYHHPSYERLTNIEQYVQKGAELTRQLLGFARSGKYDVKATDLNRLVEQTAQMFGRAKKEITIQTKFQQDIWTVAVDQSQIEQVLLNHYVNAWQAMPGGGNLYLQTENVTLDENETRLFDVPPGKYVKVSIADTGIGMDEATQQRVFDPFFTTREMGRGTGLGLASAYGIISNHGGMITVHSSKGEGTTFCIYLPASEEKIVEERKLPEEVLAGTETVLLVDDEQMIVEVGQAVLKTLGYQVLPARSGKEAIEIYQENQGKVGLVILDMIMPGMSGSETYDRLKAINPKVKVLLSSGYSLDSEATNILKRGCDGFIQKPFTIKQLSRKIREILERR